MSTPDQTTPLRSVVIVGGGTAGWMTAASLAHRLQRLGVTITLVESSAVGTIGVGEATVPAIRRYFQSLGLDAFAVMKATNGTIKLAIEFDGWAHEGHSFMHPFGRFGLEAGPVAFHHLWNRLRTQGDAGCLDEYAMGAQLARAGRMTLPPEDPRVDFEHFDWAVHFDASKFATFLRGFAESRGVRRIDARVAEVLRDGEREHVRGIRLDTGAVLDASLFIDCSGFHQLLIEKSLHAGFVDWHHWLPCDRAVAIPCAAADPNDLAPSTRSRALAAGWAWRIPLQNRIGNGYVYSSAHLGDDAAVAALRAQLEGEALAEPNLVRFRTGHVRRFWIGNCVSIGLSAGFLEPLESTSISLIQMGIDKLLHLWPDEPPTPDRLAPLAAEYDRLSIVEYERIRDFIILHYSANGRTAAGDTALWRQCREMPLPDTLVRKIALYRARGLIQQFDSESFFDPSWLCLYGNLGIDAGSWDPLTNLLPLAELAEVTRRVREDIARTARQAKPHREFLRLAGALA
ncbi:MAG TPA: tryptophan halogenase family protein [Steroidobacteraceae bacterium]|nr:tryptophan halogenase family protein [Steroidobacteraceae bacterium]